MTTAHTDPRFRFLAQLHNAPMPAHFGTHHEIDCICALAAGKLIEATLPEVELHREGPRYAGPATVVKLTTLGRQLAETHARRSKLRRS